MVWAVAGALCCTLAVWSQAEAQNFKLQDKNSVSEFDIGTQAGMFSWAVDDVDHLTQQWFWLRVGDVGPEQSLDTLTLDDARAIDTNMSGFDDTLYTRFLGQGFMIENRYGLAGGFPGSGKSVYGEQITVTNTGNDPLGFHFFQYADFDLGGSANDRLVQITGGNTATQQGLGASVSEAIVTRAPSRVEVSLVGDILGRLNDGDADNLNNTTGPLGPGNLTWAFQWDVSIPAGGSYLISKPLSIIPEPGTVMLLLAGLGLGVRRLRRRGRV